MSTDPDSFLSRWSRRKLTEPSDGPSAAPVEAEDQRSAEDEAAGLEDKTDAEILAELDLPDPDAMQDGDDFSAFMAKAVPARLRNRALRRLWLSNPALANLDELLDYGEDYTDAATVVENLQTAYQVGKGWLPDETEPDTNSDAESEMDPDTTDATPEETAAAVPSDEIIATESAPSQGEDSASAMDEPAPAPANPAPRSLEADSAPVPAPRRMRFRADIA